MQHQVAHRPARQAEQAQQPVLHLGPLGEQREVALAAQQRLEPVDERHRRLPGAALLGDRLGGARHQARRGAACSRRAAAGSSAGRRAAAPAPPAPAAAASRKLSASTGCGGGPQLRQPLPVRAAAVVQQQVELGGDELAGLAEAVEQRARAVAAVEAQAGGDPGEVAVAASAGHGSAGRRGTGCGARPGAAACRPPPAARRWPRFIRPPAASLSSAFSVERVRISGNWPPRTTSSSWTMNSISRMPPRDSLTSLARSGRPAARRWASSRTLAWSWRRPSKTP